MTSKAVVSVKEPETVIDAIDSKIVSGPNAKWNPEDNFVGAKDAKGQDVPISEVKVTGIVDPQPPW